MVLCTGACDVNGATEPANPRVIQVSVLTTGDDPDNSYVVSLDNQTIGLVGVSGKTRFNVSRGMYTVTIRDISDNCLLSGPPERKVDLRKMDSASVIFELDCAATGLEIRTQTEGPDTPSSHFINVTGLARSEIGLNDTKLITRLHPGQYTVEIVYTPDNCVANAAIVQVENRKVKHVDLTMTCVAAVRADAIVYSSDTAGSESPVLMLTSVDGTKTLRLGTGSGASWSPDGKRIVFTEQKCDPFTYYYYNYSWCTNALRLMDPEVGFTRLLDNGANGFNPAWSPVVDVIAFDRENVLRGIYLLTMAGQVTKVNIPGVTEAFDPDWSPDGSRLVFTCIITAAIADLCTAKPDGTGLVRLTTETVGALSPSWSRDGSTIVFYRLNALREMQISVIPATGGDISDLGPGSFPSWSPDGSKILFSTDDGLFTMNVDGTGRQRLTLGRHFGAAWRKSG
jgi:TolB protein